MGGRRPRCRTCAAGNEDFSATVPGFGLPPLLPVRISGDPGLQIGQGGLHVLQLPNLIKHPCTVRGQAERSEYSRRVRDHRP